MLCHKACYAYKILIFAVMATTDSMWGRHECEWSRFWPASFLAMNYKVITGALGRSLTSFTLILHPYKLLGSQMFKRSAGMILRCKHVLRVFKRSLWFLDCFYGIWVRMWTFVRFVFEEAFSFHLSLSLILLLLFFVWLPFLHLLLIIVLSKVAFFAKTKRVGLLVFMHAFGGQLPFFGWRFCETVNLWLNLPARSHFFVIIGLYSHFISFKRLLYSIGDSVVHLLLYKILCQRYWYAYATANSIQICYRAIYLI